MWRGNIEQAEEERKRHTAIIEEYKKVGQFYECERKQKQPLNCASSFFYPS